MIDSILTSIKTILGIEAEDTAFDQELIAHINSVLISLTQLGIGPSDGFLITSDAETWQDFIGDNKMKRGLVETFVGLKVRLIFDPPMNATAVEAIKETVKELEFRLYIIENPKNTFEKVEGENDDNTSI